MKVSEEVNTKVQEMEAKAKDSRDEGALHEGYEGEEGKHDGAGDTCEGEEGAGRR